MSTAERIDRYTFFQLIRETVFGGRMSQSAVTAINTILDECERRGLNDTRMIAYVLATVRGEVGPSMWPVSERGKGRGRRYGEPDPRTGQTYYGRGWVQLTWYDNYLKQERKLDLPLTTQPDLLLRPDVSAKVLLGGMIDGDFRKGHRLSTYFTPTKTDWLGAREIINGKHRSSDAYADKAEQFALWAQQFNQALERATVPVKMPKALTKKEVIAGGAVAAGGGAAVVGAEIAEKDKTTTAAPRVDETAETTTASPQAGEVAETNVTAPEAGETAEMVAVAPQAEEKGKAGEASAPSLETVETTGANSPITETIEPVKDAHAFSGWHLFGIAAVVLIAAGVLFALYALRNGPRGPRWPQT